MEYSRRHEGKADGILQYCLEWSFFARNQWGMYDTALIELEHAWNSPYAASPPPVTMGGRKPEFVKKIRVLDDVHAAIDHYCEKTPLTNIKN